MNTVHDPYLNTVRRSLNEKKNKDKKVKLQKRKQVKPKSFLQKTIHLDELIDLPDGLRNALIMSLFLFIPYLVGVISILILMFQDGADLLLDFSLMSFLLSWVIGYEFIALFMLVYIMKQALTFNSGLEN